MKNFFNYKNNKLIILFIVIFAFLLRIYGLNWDQGNHLHPDERMITMVTEGIKIPDLSNANSLSEKISILFSPESTLNPKFFAYGSLPIYLLRLLSSLFSLIDQKFLSYDYTNLLGRGISAFFDSLTLIFIYKISQLLFFSRKKSILAAFIYAISIFPIQLSHFYAVDTLLNFFIFFTLYHSIKLYNNFNLKNAIGVGLGFGLSLATKISAIALIFSLGLSLIISIFLTLKKQIFGLEISFLSKIKLYFKKIFSPRFWVIKKRRRLKLIISYSLLIALITLFTFTICQPFSIFDFPTFWRQINEQHAMTKDAFVFPYTLQYVNTPSYLYQLKNIFLWGLGPIFAFIAYIGIIFGFIELLKGLFSSGNEKSEGGQLIIFSFFIIYFLITGNFAVKFMRYSLPLYPIFAIFAANFIFSFSRKIRRFLIPTILLSNCFILLMFLNIYRYPNTRVQATKWINENIPAGSIIAREHWDDGLPIGNINGYQFLELALYDSDYNPQKWPVINSQLKESDYYVIASNRLYTPLQKLTDCKNLPIDKCYQETALFYQKLFSNRLNFEKVAEFSVYPSFLGITVNDQSADESFTVYDHPKVIIFKNNNSTK